MINDIDDSLRCSVKHVQHILMKKIKYAELRKQRYNEICTLTDIATPFHSLEWLELINATRSDMQLEFIVIYDSNQEIAFLPYFTKRKWRSLLSFMPYGAYSGFIYEKRNEKEVFDFLKTENFANLITRIISFDSDVYSTLKYLHETNDQYSTWILDTTKSYDEIWANIHSKTRNQIRKSFKENVIYKRIETRKEVDDCKKLYSNLVKKHNIKLPFSSKFFEETSRMSIEGRNIKFNIATYADHVISYCVFVTSKTHVFYWLNASDPNYGSLNATNGILSSMIQSCCETYDIKLFNFGAVPYGNDNLMHFKKNWGAIEKKYRSYHSLPLYIIIGLKKRLDQFMHRIQSMWAD